MKKLFSLEDNDDQIETKDILLKSTNPLELTKVLIAQKDSLKQQLKSQFENSENNTEDKEKDTETKDDKEEKKDTEQNKEENKENEESKEVDFSDIKKENENEEKDGHEIAEDKDELKSIVGSAVTNEHISIPYFANKSYFSNLYLSYENYLTSLSKYKNIKPISLEEQKVVYVKEDIVESLTKVVNDISKHIAKNNSFISSNTTTLQELNKTITTYQEALPGVNYSFNLKLIKDEDILINLSVNNKVDTRSAIISVSDLSNNMTKLIQLILNNDFSSIRDSFLNSGFKFENNEYEYSKPLPAFTLIKAKIPDYINYTKTDVNKYEIYSIQYIIQENISNLNAIEISNDNDLKYIVEKSNILLFNLSNMIEDLTIINTNATALIDKIKALIFDIENNKVTNLAELGIDDLIKQVIQFNIMLQAINITFRICLNTLNSILNFLSLTVELKFNNK